MKKYIKVSNGNIHIVLFRIKQFVNRMEVISMQAQYPIAVKMKKLFPNDKSIVVKSQLSYLSQHDCVIEIDKEAGGNKYIRVNYQQNTHAFLIQVGDKIRFTGNNIYTKYKNTLTKNTVIETWQAGNKLACKEQTHWSVITAHDYDMVCEEELNNELN